MTRNPPRDVRTSGRRLPPGQIETKKWPVLHYSHVPTIDPGAWRFTVRGEVDRPFELGWPELLALEQEEVLCDLHCVTRWSRFDTVFTGVAVSSLLAMAKIRPNATHVLVHADPDYTTSLPLADLDRPGNLLAHRFSGLPLSAEHGGPVRLLVPHLYLWKSAKWVTGFELLAEDVPGFWEENGYHMRGDPWAEERYGTDDYLRMRRGSRR